MKTNTLFFGLLTIILTNIQSTHFAQAEELNTTPVDEFDARQETDETTEYNVDEALALFTNDMGEVDWDAYFLYMVNRADSPLSNPNPGDSISSPPTSGSNTATSGSSGSTSGTSTDSASNDGNSNSTEGSNTSATADNGEGGMNVSSENSSTDSSTEPGNNNEGGTNASSENNSTDGTNSTGQTTASNNSTGSEQNTSTANNTDGNTGTTSNNSGQNTNVANSSSNTGTNSTIGPINANVSSVNQSTTPIAPSFYADYEVSTYPNTAVIISFKDIIGTHDWYIPNDMRATREPANGHLYYNHDHSITYTPTHGFAGVDTFMLPNSEGSPIIIAVRVRNDYSYWDFLGTHNDDGYWGEGYGWFKNSDDEWFFDGDSNWRFEDGRWFYPVGNGDTSSNAQYLGHWGQPDDPAYWSVPVQCKPAPRFYAVHDEGISDSQLLSIDPWSQKSENIGPMQIEYDIEGIDISPTNYRLYAISGNENDPKTERSGVLHIINPRTGAMTVVGNTGYKDVTALAFDIYGGLWGWSKGQGLIKINPDNGQSYLYAAFHLIKVDGLAWSSDGEVLYASAQRDLWMYSKKTNTLATVCENVKLLPGDKGRIEALETFGDGMLLMATHQNANNLLYIYDPVKCEVVAFKEFESNYPDIESIAWSCQVNQSTRHPTNSLDAQPPLLAYEIKNYFKEAFGENSIELDKKNSSIAVTITDEYGKTQTHKGILSAYLPAVPGYNGPAEFLPLLNEYGQHVDIDGDGYKDYTFTYSDGRMQLVLYKGTE